MKKPIIVSTSHSLKQKSLLIIVRNKLNFRNYLESQDLTRHHETFVCKKIKNQEISKENETHRDHFIDSDFIIIVNSFPFSTRWLSCLHNQDKMLLNCCIPIHPVCKL